MGALRSCWQPDRSIQIPRERCTAESFAILAMPPCGWRRQARLLRRNPSKKNCSCANLVCLTPGVHPKPVCQLGAGILSDLYKNERLTVGKQEDIPVLKSSALLCASCVRFPNCTAIRRLIEAMLLFLFWPLRPPPAGRRLAAAQPVGRVMRRCRANSSRAYAVAILQASPRAMAVWK